MSYEVYAKTLDFLEKIAPTVIIPVAVVWLSNRLVRKQKVLDQDFEIRKMKELKQFESDHQHNISKRDYERVVHSSLVKILFQVQRLHISLSGSCVDLKCIDDAVIKFNQSLEVHQNIISENQIFVSSKTINKVYQFYSTLGELLIELRELSVQKEYGLAMVPVYDCSQNLADIIIDVQNEFARKRQDISEELNSLEVPYFKACCGQEPPLELRKQILEIRNKRQALTDIIDSLPNIEGDIHLSR
jgi:hypothetical protein